MKKRKPDNDDPDMLPEYDFRGGERGRLARRFGGRVGVLLDPDVADFFGDSSAINEVLKKVADLFRLDRQRRTPKPRARRRR